MPISDMAELAESPGYLLKQAVQTMQVTVERAIEPCGLSLVQYDVLGRLPHQRGKAMPIWQERPSSPRNPCKA